MAVRWADWVVARRLILRLQRRLSIWLCVGVTGWLVDCCKDSCLDGWNEGWLKGWLEGWPEGCAFGWIYDYALA